MKTFARFIEEARQMRSAERADRLAHYVIKRQNARSLSNDDYITLPNKANFSRSDDARHAMREKFPGLAGVDIFRHHGTKMKMDPHHLIPTQHDVAHNSAEFMNVKMPDNEPIDVVKHRGKHLIWDGHHRWFRDKLLRSHSDINLVDLDK